MTRDWEWPMATSPVLRGENGSAPKIQGSPCKGMGTEPNQPGRRPAALKVLFCD